MRYVVVEIGCLECGEPSTLLSADTDRSGAERLGARFADELDDDDWHGQGMTVAFPIEPSPAS